MSFLAFTKAYGTDEACRAHMESVRWPHGPVCPRCGVVDEAVAISTRPGQRRCRACGKHYTVAVGTAMEGLAPSASADSVPKPERIKECVSWFSLACSP